MQVQEVSQHEPECKVYFALTKCDLFEQFPAVGSASSQLMESPQESGSKLFHWQSWHLLLRPLYSRCFAVCDALQAASVSLMRGAHQIILALALSSNMCFSLCRLHLHCNSNLCFACSMYLAGPAEPVYFTSIMNQMNADSCCHTESTAF